MGKCCMMGGHIFSGRAGRKIAKRSSACARCAWERAVSGTGCFDMIRTLPDGKGRKQYSPPSIPDHPKNWNKMTHGIRRFTGIRSALLIKEVSKQGRADALRMLTHQERRSIKPAVFWLSHYGASKFARVKAKLHALSSVLTNCFIIPNSYFLSHSSSGAALTHKFLKQDEILPEDSRHSIWQKGG